MLINIPWADWWRFFYILDSHGHTLAVLSLFHFHLPESVGVVSCSWYYWRRCNMVGSVRRNWHPSSNLLDRANQAASSVHCLCCNKTSWIPQCTMLADNARTCLDNNGMTTHIATTCKPMPKYMRQHVFAFRSKSKDVCAVIHLIVQIEHVIPVFRGMALPTHGYTRPVMLW